MKYSPIDLLYYDFIEKYDFIKLGEEYDCLLEEVLRYGDILRKALSEKKQKILTKLMNGFADLEAQQAHTCFREGFLAGVRLMKEVFFSTEEK